MRGFTMIELIVVIFIMAILMSYAAPRFFARGDVEGPAYAQELASAARYAQKYAVTTGCPVQLTVTTAGYALKQGQAGPSPACDTTFTRDVYHPSSGDPFAASTPSGVTITGSVPVTVEFKAKGTPYIGITEMASDLAITIAPRTVIIHGHSGFVNVQ